METSSSEWVKFFKDSGLPNAVSTKYAVIFSNHRIQLDMLKDLTKEILYDMGIKTMGDVIAILRHAKTVDEEATKVEILGKDSVSASSKKSPQALGLKSAGEAVGKRKMDDNMVMTKPKMRKILPPKDSSELESYEYMSEGSTYVIKMPGILSQMTNTAAPSSIFTRLGSQDLGKSPAAETIGGSSVFSRLGGSVPSSQNRIRLINSTSSKGSVLRGAEGASSTLTSSLPRKATATVKPTNVLIRKSLAEATGKQAGSINRTLPSKTIPNAGVSRPAAPVASFNSSLSVKDRLGGQRNVSSPNDTSNSRILTSKKLVVTKEQPAKRNTLSLKKSIFDRLGPMTL